MFDKMKQLMEMQKKMQEMKRALDVTVFEVASSDGLVRISMNGSQEVESVSLSDSAAAAPKSALEKSLQDAYNKAIKRSQAIAAEKMKEMTGFGIPGM
jgi:DNA-binding YbaB/EbfC family protein